MRFFSGHVLWSPRFRCLRSSCGSLTCEGTLKLNLTRIFGCSIREISICCCLALLLASQQQKLLRLLLRSQFSLQLTILLTSAWILVVEASLRHFWSKRIYSVKPVVINPIERNDTQTSSLFLLNYFTNSIMLLPYAATFLNEKILSLENQQIP